MKQRNTHSRRLLDVVFTKSGFYEIWVTPHCDGPPLVETVFCEFSPESITLMETHGREFQESNPERSLNQLEELCQ